VLPQIVIGHYRELVASRNPDGHQTRLVLRNGLPLLSVNVHGPFVLSVDWLNITGDLTVDEKFQVQCSVMVRAPVMKRHTDEELWTLAGARALE
jgi:hypothetical protein